jgi:ABC-type transport system involved in multi-copper enzyme maturation permease subunit
MKEPFLKILGIIIIGIFIVLLSWIVTCGFIKLITICFGWTFKWSIATGIWLILLLLEATLKPESK